MALTAISYGLASGLSECQNPADVPKRKDLIARRMALKWSQADIVERTGLNIGTVSNAERGGNSESATLAAIERALSEGERDLPDHTGTRVLASDAEDVDRDIGVGYVKNDVPVVGEAEASSNGLIIWGDDGIVRSQVERWVSRSYADGDPKAYGLVVRNDSMAEKYLPGAVVIAQPRLEVRDGHFAVVYMKSGERLVKRVFKTSTGWLLKSTNAQYPDREVTTDDVRMIHRIRHSIEP